ncbi:unnamed protein product [Lathyrus oleraceus]
MSATSRREFKKISMLLYDDNAEVKDQSGLCEVAKEYFNKLFAEKNGIHELVLATIEQIISREDNDKLLVPIAKDELFEALTRMHLNKSPRPDGFNPAFYQKI